MTYQKKVIKLIILFISETNNPNMLLDITKFLGYFYPQIDFKFYFY